MGDYAIITTLGVIFRTLIIEYSKNKRFKRFKKFYPNENFEKLSEYEERLKFNFFKKNEQ
jgi:hypothetical protein